MKELWNLNNITADEWLDPDSHALLAHQYGGKRNLRALVFGLRSDLVAAELSALTEISARSDRLRASNRG